MTFDQAFEVLMKHEGGYVNDPRDPGGETKYGISKRAYPDIDVANLTVDQARDIYRRDYWDACKCDELPIRARLLVFDSAVNQGVGTAIRLYQEALGVKADGVIGPKTIEASYKNNNDETYAEFMALRSARYQKHPKFDVFGKGWTKRMFDVMARSMDV